MRQTLIVNLDYCASCRGNCPSCVLGRDERADVRSLLGPGRVDRALAGIVALHSAVGTLVLGVGRGDTLALPEDSVRDLVAFARSAERRFGFHAGLMEISTSLMGRAGAHLTRAGAIVEAFWARGLRLDPRFVVVADTALTSPTYWRGIDTFLRTLEATRGGDDGAGDILVVNLSAGHLPDLDRLADRVGGYRFPVNVTWTPAFDPALRSVDGVDALGRWLAGFYRLGRRLGLDSNLLTRADLAMQAHDLEPGTLADHIAANGAAMVFVDRDGACHGGYASVSADMDPVRFDPAGEVVSAMAAEPGTDLARLMRHPACRGCAFLGACVASGAHKAALMTLRNLPPGARVCPSAMRGVFEEAAHG